MEVEQNPLLSFTISLCGSAATLLVWGCKTGIRLGMRLAWYATQPPATLHEGGIRAGSRLVVCAFVGVKHVCVCFGVYIHFDVCEAIEIRIYNWNSCHRFAIVLLVIFNVLTSLCIVWTSITQVWVRHFCSELTPRHLADLCGHYNCEVQSSLT